MFKKIMVLAIMMAFAAPTFAAAESVNEKNNRIAREAWEKREEARAERARNTPPPWESGAENKKKSVDEIPYPECNQKKNMTESELRLCSEANQKYRKAKQEQSNAKRANDLQEQKRRDAEVTAKDCPNPSYPPWDKCHKVKK